VIKPEDVIQFATAIARFKSHLESQVKTYNHLAVKLGGDYKLSAKHYSNELEEFNLILGEIE